MDLMKIESLISEEHAEDLAVDVMHSKPKKVYELGAKALESDTQRTEVIKSYIMDLSQLNAIQLKNWLDKAIENNLFDE